MLHTYAGPQPPVVQQSSTSLEYLETCFTGCDAGGRQDPWSIVVDDGGRYAIARTKKCKGAAFTHIVPQRIYIALRRVQQGSITLTSQLSSLPHSVRAFVLARLSYIVLRSSYILASVLLLHLVTRHYYILMASTTRRAGLPAGLVVCMDWAGLICGLLQLVSQLPSSKVTERGQLAASLLLWCCYPVLTHCSPTNDQHKPNPYNKDCGDEHPPVCDP